MTIAAERPLVVVLEDLHFGLTERTQGIQFSHNPHAFDAEPTLIHHEDQLDPIALVDTLVRAGYRPLLRARGFWCSVRDGA